eukprot:402739-Hanusia_phi.AAC.2
MLIAAAAAKEEGSSVSGKQSRLFNSLERHNKGVPSSPQPALPSAPSSLPLARLLSLLTACSSPPPPRAPQPPPGQHGIIRPLR